MVRHSETYTQKTDILPKNIHWLMIKMIRTHTLLKLRHHLHLKCLWCAPTGFSHEMKPKQKKAKKKSLAVNKQFLMVLKVQIIGVIAP